MIRVLLNRIALSAQTPQSSRKLVNVCIHQDVVADAICCVAFGGTDDSDVPTLATPLRCRFLRREACRRGAATLNGDNATIMPATAAAVGYSLCEMHVPLTFVNREVEALELLHPNLWNCA
jgi:hypothetical protein